SGAMRPRIRGCPRPPHRRPSTSGRTDGRRPLSPHTADGGRRRAARYVKMKAREGAKVARIRVGTCAWSDHEEYYPPGLPARERLSYYAQHFSLVEVDSTFYRLQPARWFESWAERTPPDFRFNVKAYGAITRHHREPRPGEEDLVEVFRRFDASVQPLREAGKLGALHFQFPPWFTCTQES